MALSQGLQELVALGKHIFSKRSRLDAYWQASAEAFYPERASFTASLQMGDDLTEHLTTSYPVIARRELASSLSSMMRPRDREWFKIGVGSERTMDSASKQFLEWSTGTLRRAMYARPARFTAVMPVLDNDYATFGQGVVEVGLNSEHTDFLYKSKHLKDIAWMDDVNGKTCAVFERWRPTAYDLKTLFRGKVHPEVDKMVRADNGAKRFHTVDCMRIVVKRDLFDGDTKKWPQPFVSIYIDLQNDHVIEETGSWVQPYVIPRWLQVDGSQYAHSPATVAALPDARLLQAISLALLDASEWQATPPMVAMEDALRSDINLSPRGITYIDSDYDERTGPALRSAVDGRSVNLQYAFELRNDVKDMIAQAFFLNKIKMPPAMGKEMTAFEVGQRVQEYIRSALPLFEPMESEVNGGICETSFIIGQRNGLFGPPESYPEALRSQELEFTFRSPLTEAIERKYVTQFQEAGALLAQAAEVDRGLIGMVNPEIALRDALNGAGVSPSWIRDEDEFKAKQEEDQQAMAAQQAIATAQAGGEAAQAVGEGVQALKGPPVPA